MAAVYDIDSGNELTTGLQGCNKCNEALQVAEGLADSMGRDVHLVDDDGEWAVHPELNGEREAADQIKNKTEIRATIIERGNGFPDVGDRIYDSQTDTIYEILSMGRIQTQQYAGNWRDARLEDTGLCASDLDDDEFDSLSDCGLTLDDQS